MCFYKKDSFKKNTIVTFCNNHKVLPNRTKYCYTIDCDVCLFFENLYGYKYINMFINNGVDIQEVLMKRAYVYYGN